MKNYLLFFLLCVLQVSAQNDTILPINNEKIDVDLKNSKWDFYLKGFVQVDYMIDFNEMRSKDGFGAASIVDGKTKVSDYFSVRQSAFGVGANSPDKKFTAYVEIDLIGKNGATEPRFRHYYVRYGNFLAGQYWSNTSDLETWPNIVDFDGANGALLSRTLQFRYTTQLSKRNLLILSLEVPKSQNVTLPENSLGWKQRYYIPNFVASFRHERDNKHVKVAAIVNPINYKYRNSPDVGFQEKTIFGLGIVASGAYKFPSTDHIKFQTSFGKGFSNYDVSVGGAGFVALPNPDLNNLLNALSMFNGVVSYEHRWAPKWTSVAYYSYSSFLKESFLQDSALPRTFQNMTLNVIYTPVKRIFIGAELTHGFLQTFANNNIVGGTRLQFSTRYKF